MRILHVFRTPVGGLFRHVRDLARGQAELGHDVGLFCDSSTGGDGGDALMEAVRPYCSLGIRRVPISKMPGLGDTRCVKLVKATARELKIDVIHGHGAKGGLYGRLAGRLSAIKSVYSPHGGSLHYDWASLAGPFFLGTEWALGHAGNGFIFVCDFEKNLFTKKIGLAGRPSRVVHNGLWPEEFKSPALQSDATDLLYVGEMRKLKGVDVLLGAIAELNKTNHVTATLVGEGESFGDFKALAQNLKIADRVRFVGRRGIAEALTMGKLMILPSRNESFPYVVLETIAASTPIIASNVGGISEVLPTSMLVPAGDVKALATKISISMQSGNAEAEALSKLACKQFSAAKMVANIVDFYGEILK